MCLAVQVTFKGDGPLGGIQVVADALGSVKGKVGCPRADPPLRPDGKLDVGGAVGRGVCSPNIYSANVSSKHGVLKKICVQTLSLVIPVFRALANMYQGVQDEL